MKITMNIIIITILTVSVIIAGRMMQDMTNTVLESLHIRVLRLLKLYHRAWL